MIEQLKVQDCGVISLAASSLNSCISDIERNIAKYIDQYGEEDLLTRTAKMQFDDTTERRMDLLKFANRCGCNINIDTGTFK